MANTGDCLSSTLTYFSTGAARMLDGFIEAYHRRARQLSVAIVDGALNFFRREILLRNDRCLFG